MTDAEINKAVAESIGRTHLTTESHGELTLVLGKNPNGTTGTGFTRFNGKRIFGEPVMDYANSLDAIVPVVREWIQKVAGGDGTIRLYFEQGLVEAEVEAYPHDMVQKVVRVDALAPARALCLAFLQAVEAAK